MGGTGTDSRHPCSSGPDIPVVLVSGMVDPLGLTKQNTGADAVVAKNASEVSPLVRGPSTGCCTGCVGAENPRGRRSVGGNCRAQIRLIALRGLLAGVGYTENR